MTARHVLLLGPMLMLLAVAVQMVIAKLYAKIVLKHVAQQLKRAKIA